MITERVQGHGGFTIALKADTPASITSLLVEFGHILVFDTRVDATALADAGMKAAARYTGVLYRPARSLTRDGTIAGHAPLVHLGDWDGKGDILETAWTGPAVPSFVNWITGLLGTINATASPLSAGTISAVAAPAAGELSRSFIHLNRRQILDYICDYYSATYRVNPDFTVDAGTDTAVFNTTPQVVLAQDAGSDPTISGLPATVLDVRWDAQDWTSKVLVYGEGQQTDTIVVGTATIGVNPYKDGLGNALVRKRPVSSPVTASGEAATIATTQLGRFTSVDGAITASTSHEHARALVEAGDSIYAWYPAGRLSDTDNETQHRGRILNPPILQVYEITWPLREGRSVWYRDLDGVYTDLTPHVIFEASDTVLRVGAASKKIANRETPAIPERTFAQPAQTVNIVDAAVTQPKIALLAVDAARIANATITDAQIGSLNADKITAGTLDADTVTVSGTLDAAALIINGTRVTAGAVASPYIASTLTGKILQATQSTYAYSWSADTTTALRSDAAGQLYFYVSGSAQYYINTSRNLLANHLYNNFDNLYDIGEALKAFQDVYAYSYPAVSDITEKTDITESALGLDFMLALRGAQWRWRDSADRTAMRSADAEMDRLRVLQQSQLKDGQETERSAETGRKIYEIAATRPTLRKPGRRLHHGLIAQDVIAALDQVGVPLDDFGGVLIDESGRHMIRHQEFFGPVVNAFREIDNRLKVLEGS